MTGEPLKKNCLSTRYFLLDLFNVDKQASIFTDRTISYRQIIVEKLANENRFKEKHINFEPNKMFKLNKTTDNTSV